MSALCQNNVSGWNIVPDVCDSSVTLRLKRENRVPCHIRTTSRRIWLLILVFAVCQDPFWEISDQNPLIYSLRIKYPAGTRRWNNVASRKHTYNFDPFKHHFYIVKLGFTGVYTIFHISAQKTDCEYSLEPPQRGGSNEYTQSMFWADIWIMSEFLSENSVFWWWNFQYTWIGVFSLWIQRWFNGLSMNQRWIDIVSTLCACWGYIRIWQTYKRRYLGNATIITSRKDTYVILPPLNPTFI